MTLTIDPIGYIHCLRKYKGETPRQSVDARNTGTIELLPNKNYEAALDDLSGFDHIWVIFGFHLNYQQDWRPKAAPPVIGGKKRIGLFATRSPYRPNPIGTSCVELVKVDRLTLHIRNFDMLDGTPVFDIKPYIARCDSFPDAATGWLPENIQEYQVSFSEVANKQADFIYNLCSLDLVHYATTQLTVNPLNAKRKRISETRDGYILSCRTWRMLFTITNNNITIHKIESNYSPDELAPGEPDKYGDKDVHRQFCKT